MDNDFRRCQVNCVYMYKSIVSSVYVCRSTSGV